MAQICAKLSCTSSAEERILPSRPDFAFKVQPSREWRAEKGLPENQRASLQPLA